MAAVVVGLAAHGVGLGLGQDLDSRSIFENSVPAILRGSYVVGRSWGNPLYEFAAAWLYSAGGVVLANSYSVLLAVGAILIMDRLLRRCDIWRRSLALAGLSLGPVFLVNSSGFGEWMQAYFLVLCLLWAASRWLEEQRPRYLSLYGLFCALLVLTRPDAAFICVSVCVAMMWHLRFERTRCLRLIAASAAAGGATAAIFVLLNGGIGFLSNLTTDHNNTWLRSLIVAVVDTCVLFGYAGVPILIGCAVWLLARLWRGESRPLTFWGRLFLVGLAVGLPRYVIYPQKPEYIFQLAIFALLMVAHERARLVWAWLLSLSLVLPSLVTVSLFERHGTDDNLRVRLRLGPSGIVQDWANTRADWQLLDPDFLRKVAERVYADEPGPPPRLYTKTYGPGLLSDTGDLVIGESEAYRLDNPRSGPAYRRDRYRRIFVCDRTTFPGSPGWRFSQPPEPRLTIDPRTGAIDARCHREAAAGGLADP